MQNQIGLGMVQTQLISKSLAIQDRPNYSFNGCSSITKSAAGACCIRLSEVGIIPPREEQTRGHGQSCQLISGRVGRSI